MPQTIAVENNFTRGLITQATGMNFPENACTSTANMIFRPWGLCERRLGFDVEPGANFQNITVTNTTAFTQFVWKDATGNGNINITIFQVGNFLYCYNMANAAISQGLIAALDITAFSAGAPASTIAQVSCQFAVGNGYLIVFHSWCNPFYVSYNSGTNILTGNTIDVRFRDTYGIDDKFISGLEDNVRPSTLTPDHNYNLFNQGWNQTMLTQFNTTAGVYPSNNDTPWLFNTDSNARNFDQNAINAMITASGKTPRGHFVLSAGTEDRAAASGLGVSYPANYPTPIGMGNRRFGAGAFWSSRVWYAGVPLQGFNNKIYFSQIAINFDNFGKCYQTNDPTNSDLFDILPSDGGIIVIQEIGTIYKLFPYQNALFVFSNTGVWAITGSSGVGLGFTATDYTVHKISSVPAISQHSFVDVYGLPMWWNLTGVYTIVPGQNGFTVQSVSDKTILNFFAALPTDAKLYARGAFDPIFGIVQWIYRSVTTGTPGFATVNQRFDSILNYNIETKAFYGWTLPGIYVPPLETFIGGIIYDEKLSTLEEPRFKYVLIRNWDVTGPATATSTFVETFTPNYTDLSTIGLNQNYSSFITTGYKPHGQADKRFQTLYTTIYFQNQNLTSSTDPRTVEGSCLFSYSWDFATDPNTGRISSTQQALVTNEKYSNAMRKFKIRGRGRAVQLNFVSVDGYPMDLEGWVMEEVINKQV